MKKNTLFYLSFLFILSNFFNGCVGLRSAKGLDQGELSVNYYAPLAGAVRYGLTDNIEVKGMLIFEVYYFDVFVHTNRDSGKVNFGFTLGTYNNYDYGYRSYLGGTISKRISKYFTPYAGIFLYTKSDSYKERIYQFSLGTEVNLYIADNSEFKFFLVPEIMITPQIKNRDFGSPVYGTVGIGMNFNFLKLFKSNL